MTLNTTSTVQLEQETA